MECQNCGSEELQFFNESVYERRKKNIGFYYLLFASIILLLVGLFIIIGISSKFTISEMKVITGIIPIENISTTNDLNFVATLWEAGKYVAVAGAIATVLVIIYAMIPRYKQTFRIKVFCTKCGSQFILVQDVQKTIEIITDSNNVHTKAEVNKTPQ